MQNTAQKTKIDVYQMITDRVIEFLKQDLAPWRKPWRSVQGTLIAPKNGISGKNYRGINAFLLNCLPYEDPYYLTFKQVQQLGGRIQKGQKGFPVIFYKLTEIKESKEEQGKKVLEVREIPLIRYHIVFNVEQCEGITLFASEAPQEEEEKELSPIQACENIIFEMPNPPEIINKPSNRAYYQPSADRIVMPERKQFESSEEYYATLFHELGHSTGHPSRLNRKDLVESTGFGSEPYSREELTAEMIAGFLCGFAGIEPSTLENSAAYIQSWIARLQDDKKLVIEAASRAQKACDYILDRESEEPIAS
ncbi:MAG: zincin-like metallopeptidase domain-containing protein [Microscillaceae bacterium]|nr:zincin-like metallopeptidase domain-containing protein [Microscillaceae bacterium]